MADLDVAVTLKFLTTGSEKLKAAARDLAAFGKVGGKASGRLGGDMSKAWSASVKLGGALDKSAAAAGKTAAAIRSIGGGAGAIDKTRASIDRLAKSANTATASNKKLRGAGVMTAAGAGAIGSAASRRRAALREGISESVSYLAPGAGVLLGSTRTLAIGAGVGMAVAAGYETANKSIGEAIDRNKAFADIQKKVNLEAGQTWGTINKDIRSVSTTLGMSYSDAAGIFAQGGQGNIAGRDLKDFAMLSAKVATAWDIAPRAAAQTMTEIKGQTGWDNKGLQTFADKVNYLGDISAAAEKDIGSMWQRASAGAKAAGVTYDDSLAVMTGLRSVGVQDEVAARFFGAFSSTLRTATSLKKKPQQAIAELGLTAAGIEKGMQKDAYGTIIDLMDRLGKAKNPVGIARTLFGGEWFDEVLRMREAMPEIVRLRNALSAGGFTGSLDKALSVDLNTTTSKLAQASEAIKDIFAEMAKPALPALDAIADKVIEVGNRIRSYEDRMKNPSGRSIDDYAKQTGVNQDKMVPLPTFQSLPGLGLTKKKGWATSPDAGGLGVPGGIKSSQFPAFSRIEGFSPSVAKMNGGFRGEIAQFGVGSLDASKANIGLAETAFYKLADAAKKADDASNFTATPNIDVTSGIAQLEALARKAAEVRATIGAYSNPAAGGLTVSPTISGRPGGGGGGAPSPQGSSPTPGKQSRVGAPIHIGQAHFHGVRDPAGMHRQLAAIQNRAIRSARDGALHDIA